MSMRLQGLRDSYMELLRQIDDASFAAIEQAFKDVKDERLKIEKAKPYRKLGEILREADNRTWSTHDPAGTAPEKG